MRIISGLYRGRRLATVRGDIRPTSDRLRETLFNILGSTVLGSTWVDAFAGTGAVGIEALSRGARRVVFNDTSREAIRLIKKNLETCGITEGYEIREQDAFALLRSLKTPFPQFVFFDPPYDFGRYDKLLRKMAAFGAAGPDTQVIIEVFKRTAVQPPEEFDLFRNHMSGDSRLLFFRRKG